MEAEKAFNKIMRAYLDSHGDKKEGIKILQQYADEQSREKARQQRSAIKNRVMKLPYSDDIAKACEVIIMTPLITESNQEGE